MINIRILTKSKFGRNRITAQGKISGSGLKPLLSTGVHHAKNLAWFFYGSGVRGHFGAPFPVDGSFNLFRPAHQKIETFRAGSLLLQEPRL